MKKRRPVPQPTRISGYFFQHLTNPDVRTPDNRTDTARTERTKEEVTRLLSVSYTPEGLDTLMKSRSAVEQEQIQELEELLDASWRRVEEIIERNKDRRRILEEGIPQAIDAIKNTTFWTDEDVERWFNIKVSPYYAVHGRGTIGDGSVACSSVKDCDVLSGVTSSHEEPSLELRGGCSPIDESPARDGCDGTSVLPGMHHAKAWKMTDRELLDQSKVPYCLRRLFAHLLRRRDEFPKSATLLFNAIQKIQAERLPLLEEVMQTVPFSLPLQRPLGCISSFVEKFFIKEPNVRDLDLAFSSLFKQSDKVLRDAYEKLHELRCTADANTERVDHAAVIYETLLNELRQRKSLHDEYSESMSSISTRAAVELGEMELALKECDNASKRALDTIEEQTKTYVDELRGATAHRSAVIEEINTFYEQDRARLHSSLQRKKHRARKSEEIQEKCARRIREAIKELYLEQIKYGELTQEIIAESSLLEQLDNSYTQLSNAMQRSISVIEGGNVPLLVNSLRQSEETRVNLIEQCHRHINRLRKDEHFRQCRLTAYAKDNALCWYRCLSHLASIYGSHFDVLDEKCNISMQMRYLLSYERDCVSDDLNQVRKEMLFLDAKWKDISNFLEELDEPVPPLSQLDDDPSCSALRENLMGMALTRLVHGEFSHLAPPGGKAQRPALRNGTTGAAEAAA
uniref:WGS project CAEQ00000000 data, annotated contig 430 n=1 Tax=Trypanosoma congolense (strain IL3000) TaxID=1068625 RepID=F9WFX0_TRYCI|nr:unnamed protein product [Trypanosoma congolense IL3000]